MSPDTSFIGGSLEDALRTPPYDGMFEVLPALVERFSARVWIVSKCSARVRERTEAWFLYHRIFERTGIDAANVRFCRERTQKAPTCAELGMTHFIDDRADVFDSRPSIAPLRGFSAARPAQPGPDHTGALPLHRGGHALGWRAEVDRQRSPAL